MRYGILFFLLACSFAVAAQRNPQPSDTLHISGRIRKPLVFTLAGLSQMESRKLDDVAITNHKGEPKGVARNLEGILLKDLLSKAEWDTLKPRDLNEFYFVCRTTDNYKVVFSWNELFNTETGNHVFIITERDGKKMGEMEDRILLLSATDLNTGRRHVRALKSIEVRRVE